VVKRSVLADEERRMFPSKIVVLATIVVFSGRKAAIEKQQQLEAAAGGRVASMSTVSPAAVKSKVSDGTKGQTRQYTR
jgi:hypothetical protein